MLSVLGVSPNLGLTGRTAKDIGVIATSSLYRVGTTTMAFTPQVSAISQHSKALLTELILENSVKQLISVVHEHVQCEPVYIP